MQEPEFGTRLIERLALKHGLKRFGVQFEGAIADRGGAGAAVGGEDGLYIVDAARRVRAHSSHRRMNDRVARGLELAHQRVRQVERIFDEWNRRHFAWT